MNQVRQAVLLNGVLLLVLLMAALGSLAVGPVSLPLADVWRGANGLEAEAARLILWEIRAPRTILALLVGAALGLSGAALQGFLRNPLADPGLIGTSGMAALGAVIVFYFGLSTSFPLALPLGGLAGAATSTFLLYALAGRDSSVLTLILAGVAINALAGALTALTLNFAPHAYAAMEAMLWLMGSLADRGWPEVWFAFPFVALGGLLLLLSGRGLDALSLGEDVAVSMGARLGRLRWLVIGGTAAAVGATVSVTGAVGFVGLVVPHLLRPLVGHKPSSLLLPSALGGALLVLGADMVIRSISDIRELNLGVLTALLGVPFFVHLLLRMRRTAT